VPRAACRSAADGLAADDGVDPQAGGAGQRPQAFGDLVDQFAGRREDERLGRLGRRFAGLIQQRVDQRQAEGQRLAGAGLGEAEDVMSVQRKRDRLRLDRGGLGEARAAERVVQGGLEAEGVEVEQVYS
jgi:hypothetical protein